MKNLLAAFIFSSLASLLGAAESPLLLDSQHSRIEFDVKTTLTSFTGRVAAYKADLLADSVSGEVSKAQFQIKLSDLKTGRAARDRHLLEWAQHDQFPELVYTLTALRPLGGNKFSAEGQLLFHGVAKDLVFPVSITSADRLVYSIDGETVIQMDEFGLPPIRKFGLMRVDPAVRVSFHLQGAISAK